MTVPEKHCESCGILIENAKNRQRFCPSCAKKRQQFAWKVYYQGHKEEYAEWQRKRIEMRRKPEPPKEPAPRTPPKYTIAQVDAKAKELGISYGKCNLLLEQGKITI